MRKRRLLAPAALTLLLAWASGFAWFTAAALRTPLPPPKADGIVVFTGGAERVSAGFHLLQGNAAGLLLVSGVGPAAEFPALAHRAGVAVALAPRVTLGRQAISTRGNAIETAEWAAAHRIGSLIVVTAGYHMPRALAELRRSLPDVALYPAPVQPPGMRSLAEGSTWRLLAGEYMKYLAAEAGLADLAVHVGIQGHADLGTPTAEKERGG